MKENVSGCFFSEHSVHTDKLKETPAQSANTRVTHF